MSVIVGGGIVVPFRRVLRGFLWMVALLLFSGALNVAQWGHSSRASEKIMARREAAVQQCLPGRDVSAIAGSGAGGGFAVGLPVFSQK